MMKAVTSTATSVASGSRPSWSRIGSNAGSIESIASAVMAIASDITTVNAAEPGRNVLVGADSSVGAVTRRKARWSILEMKQAMCGPLIDVVRFT